MREGALIELEKLIVESILPPAAQTQYSSGKLGIKVLEPYCNAIRSLSESYLKDSNNRAGRTLPRTAEGYALYYLPINFAKLSHLLAIAKRYLTLDSISILDLGCGPGSGALAAIEALPVKLNVTLVDRLPEMRALARTLTTNWAKLHNRALEISDFGEIPDGSTYDLIIASNFINELPEQKREEIGAALCEKLNPNGILIILEPALVETTRTLMGLRDRLLSSNLKISIKFPCTHQNPCPMLSRSKTDWCHAPLSWSPPPLVREIDEITGFNKHRIKYSAVIAQKGATLEDSSDTYRIITPVEKTRRGFESLICGDKYYGPALLPKSDLTDENRPFKRLRPFDRCKISNISTEGTIVSEVILPLHD